ncbi:SGNH/GDSL hydrolase family protein [Flavobacterium psychrotrophum]|uniref:SGNH/GDSL hydrolase family protein n=1 Tax=Flavobacterium psychrotrophum TaxID=2294119 RepID=UPI000E321029|nr:SGNH/GDSL hydrolase family protein [Flavobacterium psychrotrophum]
MKRIFLSVAMLCALCGSAQTAEPFKAGDKVAFLGDSITEAGFYEYYIWLYYMTHFPDMRVELMNVGIGGDTAEKMNARFEGDVLRLNPNKVVLTFGMNDSGYFEFYKDDAKETAKQRIANSLKNFKEMQQKFKANPQITPIIMTGSPFDHSAKLESNNFDGKKEAMEEIVAFQLATAKENKWQSVDLYHPMLELTEREQKKDPSYTITGSDRIHPGKPGHLVMAATFLKDQGLAGQPVADVAIDAAKKKVTKSVNATTNIVSTSKTGIKLEYEAKSLPFPIDSISTMWGNDHKQSEALAVYPFLKEFDSETLKVQNLKKGKYELKIDGGKIATFTAEQLATGINMAVLPTPQYKKARDIMYLNDLRAETENKLRNYYWMQFNYFKEKGLLFADSQEASDLAAKEKEGWIPSKSQTYHAMRFKEVRKMYEDDMKRITDMIYTMNKPVKHTIELVLAGE